MKKSVKGYKFMILFLLFNMLIASGFGQAALIVLILGDKVATEKFHLSVDAGLNLGTLPGFEESKMGGGVNFGLGTHIKLAEKWHLKPEFKPLSRKGARSMEQVTGVPDELIVEEYKLKINYIDIPVLLQYNITPDFFVSAGPQVSFMTDANQYAIGQLESGPTTAAKINTKALINKVDFSFPVEAGLSLHLANSRSTSELDLNVFVRFEYGFTEVFKDPAVGSSRISIIQLGASLPFIKTPEELAKSAKK